MISSLYIHIPFCISRCNYCSFNTYTGLEALQERYVKAVCAELRQEVYRGGEGRLRSVFLGGGTPTLLSTSNLQRLLSHCLGRFTVSPSVEISIEANPGTVDPEKLTHLHDSGVNRISFGVQSFNDLELRRISRIHSASDAMAAVNIAQEVGFNNISIDLMYGLPGQSAKSWQKSLETALSIGVHHLSLYQLTVEEGTPLEVLLQKESLDLPDEDEIELMDQITVESTARSGFIQYEISNYAQPGHQSRHNINYWKNNEYFGFGAGAVSYIKNTRRRNIADPEHYCRMLEAGISVQEEEETLESQASFRETVIMGLRMNSGVSVRMMEKRYGISPYSYYGQTLQRLISTGMLEKSSAFLRLTSKGRMFANRIMADLV